MKKLSMILSLFLLTSLSANAYVDSQYTSSEKFLVNVGYSAEAAKVIGITGQNPYRDMHKDNVTAGYVFKHLYKYLNPIAYGDYDFYNHSIDFNSSSWNDWKRDY